MELASATKKVPVPICVEFSFFSKYYSPAFYVTDVWTNEDPFNDAYVRIIDTRLLSGGSSGDRRWYDSVRQIDGKSL